MRACSKSWRCTSCLLSPARASVSARIGLSTSSGRWAPTDMPTAKMTSQRDDPRDAVGQVRDHLLGPRAEDGRQHRPPVKREIVTALSPGFNP